jgi:beta-lactamase regulating signal transducer with metallopeptidase domain
MIELIVDAAIKATVVLALAAGVALALRRSSAATRHLVWFLALGGVVLIPALAVMLPALQIPWPAWTSTAAEVHVGPVNARSAAPPNPTKNVVPALHPATPASDGMVAATAPEDPPAAAAINFTPPLATMEVPPAPMAGHPISWQTWLLIAWTTGVGVMVALRLIGTGVVRRRAAESAPIVTGVWRDLVNELATLLSIRRHVRLLESDRPLMPITWGMVRPVVLLPPAGAWSADRRRVVILHELAHIKRWDCLTQAVGAIACAVYWFHPLAWYAAHRLRLEREAACDDIVLASGSEPPDYAAHLLEIARGLRSPAWSPVAAVAMARRSQIESRLRGILDTKRRRCSLGRKALALGAVAALALVAPVAACRPASPDAAPAPAAAETKPAEKASLFVAVTPTAVAPEGKGLFGIERDSVNGEEELKHLLIATVNAVSDPDVAVWADEGGQANIQFINDMLLISQTRHGQQRIVGVLEALVRAGALGFPEIKKTAAANEAEETKKEPKKAVAPPTEKEPAGLIATRRQLERKIDVDFRNISAQEVILRVGNAAGKMNIVVNPECGNAFNKQSVSLWAKQKPAGWVLEQALRPNFGFKVEPGYILIDLRERLQRELPIATYPVRAADGRPLREAKIPSAALNGVVTVVRSQVNNFAIPAVAPWAEEGGAAQVMAFGHTMIVTQTLEGQARVTALLAQLVKTGALAAGSNDPIPAGGAIEPVGVAAVRRALDEPIDTDFEKVPLADALRCLTDAAPALAIQIDNSLSESGIDPTTVLVTLKAKATPVRTLLALILGNTMTYNLTGEGVRVVSASGSLPQMTSVVYRVTGVPAPAAAAQTPVAPAMALTPDQQTLMQLEEAIHKMVNHDTDRRVAAWQSDGGVGVIETCNGLLVISQTDEGQRRVAELLLLLQKTGDLKVDVAKALPKESPLKAKVRGQLAKAIDLKAEKTPLSDVLVQISHAAGLNLVIDNTMSTEGVNLQDVPVDLKVQQKPVEWILDTILPESCSYRVEEGYVLVTTQAMLFHRLPAGMYRVSGKDGRPLGTPGKEPLPILEIENLLKQTVNSASDPHVATWAEEGGAAHMDRLGDTLIVTQTEEGQRQVGLFLSRLAELGVLGADAGQGIPAKPEGPEEAAVRRALAESIDVDFNAISLADVLTFLGEKKPALALRVDPKVVAEGYDLKAMKCDVSVKQVPVEAILRQVLGNSLEYVVTPQGLKIVTRETLSQNMSTNAYKVKVP